MRIHWHAFGDHDPLRSVTMKKGVKLLEEEIGTGNEVERQKFYQIEMRCYLNKGEAIKWDRPWGLIDRCQLLEDGKVLITDVRLDREYLINGLFYGMQGMRIGGTRKLKISPHLAYGEKGIPGVIPENAVLICVVKVLEQRYAT